MSSGACTTRDMETILPAMHSLKSNTVQLISYIFRQFNVIILFNRAIYIV